MHFIGIKKVSDVIKNARNKNFKISQKCLPSANLLTEVCLHSWSTNLAKHHSEKYAYATI